MKGLVQNLVAFIKSLSLIDILFFISIIILIILIVSLIYVSRINNENKDDENDILVEEDEIEDINSLIDIELPKPVTMTNYEKEQEEKAIISYDELVKSKANTVEEINYEDEVDLEGLKVKKLDSNSLKKVNIEESSFNEEEDFLNSLKDLQKKIK